MTVVLVWSVIVVQRNQILFEIELPMLTVTFCKDDT